MSREVMWTPEIVERFITLAGFDVLENERYATLMRCRSRGFSVVKTCDILHISKSTYDRDISYCKRMYDLVYEMHPDMLPKRNKKSAY